MLTIISLQRVGEAVKAKNKKHLTRARAREKRKTRKRRTKARAVCAESSPLLRAASRGLLVRGNLPSGAGTQKRIFADPMRRLASSFSQRAPVATDRRKSFPYSDGSAQQLSAQGCHIRCANRRCVVKKVVSLLATPQIGISTQQHTSFQIS